MAFWRAIKTYDPERNIKLTTYAGKCIENSLKDFRGKYKTTTKMERMGFRVEDKAQEDEESEEPILELYPDEYKKRPEPKVIARETSEEICRSVNSLEPREKKYLCYRFGYPFDDEVPQRKAAEHFLITRTRANELEQEALRHFRAGLHWSEPGCIGMLLITGLMSNTIKNDTNAVSTRAWFDTMTVVVKKHDIT